MDRSAELRAQSLICPAHGWLRTEHPCLTCRANARIEAERVNFRAWLGVLGAFDVARAVSHQLHTKGIPWKDPKRRLRLAR